MNSPEQCEYDRCDCRKQVGVAAISKTIKISANAISRIVVNQHKPVGRRLHFGYIKEKSAKKFYFDSIFVFRLGQFSMKYEVVGIFGESW